MQAGDRHPPRVAIARRDFFNRSTGSSRQTDDVVGYCTEDLTTDPPRLSAFW